MKNPFFDQASIGMFSRNTIFKKVDWPSSGYNLHLSLLVDGRIYHFALNDKYNNT